MQEQGGSSYSVCSWNALAAPAGMPTTAIECLRRAAQEAVVTPAVHDKLRDLGVTARAGSPTELAALLSGEIKHWGEVVLTPPTICGP